MKWTAKNCRSKPVGSIPRDRQKSEACGTNAHHFSLHVGIRYAMHQSGKLKRLCRISPGLSVYQLGAFAKTGVRY